MRVPPKAGGSPVIGQSILLITLLDLEIKSYFVKISQEVRADELRIPTVYFSNQFVSMLY